MAGVTDFVRRFQQADIRWMERWIIQTPLHPGFWVRRRLRAAMTSESQRPFGVMLDAGCGQKPYAGLFTRVTKYIGMEYAPGSGYRGNSADVYGDGAAIPLASASVDSVLCTEVLEHVPDPDAVMREIARVLKPGGVVVCTAPFFYPVHDEYDFFRYSPMSVPTLMRRHGLEVVRSEPLSGTAITLAILFNLYWFEIGFLWTKWLYPLGVLLRPVLLLLALAVNVTGWVFERVLPSSHMSFNHLNVGRRPDAA
ncbi:MAG: class I SAM-dependent methyltransferase [Vicinamibacterales bacterium]